MRDPNQRVLCIGDATFREIVGHFDERTFIPDLGGEKYFHEICGERANAHFRNRDEAEDNPGFRQIIPYIAFTSNVDGHLGIKKVFVYFRSTQAGETRLHNKLSIGVGGHVDESDQHYTGATVYGRVPDSIRTTVLNSMIREVNEEVQSMFLSLHPANFTVLGYIRESSTPVGRVHLGLLVQYSLPSGRDTSVMCRDQEMKAGQMLDVRMLRAFMASGVDLEPWSQIALEQLIWRA